MKTRKQEIREIQEMYGIKSTKNNWFFDNVVLPILGILLFFLLLLYGCSPKSNIQKTQYAKKHKIECPMAQKIQRKAKR